MAWVKQDPGHKDSRKEYETTLDYSAQIENAI